jgi:hypothetical protein
VSSEGLKGRCSGKCSAELRFSTERWYVVTSSESQCHIFVLFVSVVLVLVMASDLNAAPQYVRYYIVIFLFSLSEAFTKQKGYILYGT